MNVDIIFISLKCLLIYNNYEKSIGVFVCLAGIYSSYAQQRIDALEFVKNAPWDLTESEIDEKYKENSFELADSLKVSLAASSGGNLNFANKFLDEFCIGKYNGFTLYTINEETRKPDMFFTYIHPEQIANTDETELLRYMDSLLYVRLGEPDHKQDDYSDDNGNFVMRLWAKGTDLTVVITASLMKIVESPETPLMYFVSVAKADDGSNDFRNARWGDSMSQIVEKEGRKMNGRDRYLIRMFIRSVRVWRISYVMSSIFSLQMTNWFVPNIILRIFR